MKLFSKEEIEAKVKEIWIDDFYYDEEHTRKRFNPPDISVEINEDRPLVQITLSQMYSSPQLNLKVLRQLADFFETDNINDDERFADEGCETCDYGSSYGFTLSVRPE